MFEYLFYGFSGHEQYQVKVILKLINFRFLSNFFFERCTESSCRFPDDVRFNVKPEGIRCEFNGELGGALTIKFSFFVLILSFVVQKILA